MAIILDDNLKISGPLPGDSRYFNNLVPYSGITEVNSIIPIGERYLGLTVLIESGGSNIEYWYKEGVTDPDLVEKKFASEQLVGDFITGATNLGYFEGQTGVQTLLLSGFPQDGLYDSKLNWYYADPIIKIGSPTHDGPLRRAYVKVDGSYSWIYNTNVAGWSLATGDVTANVGNIVVDNPYGTPRYTEEDWSTFVSSGTTSINPSGSLTTGNTITIGNPIYSHKSNQDLHLRTVINDTPEFLKIDADEYYLRFSGVSSVITANNYGTGVGVYSGKTGTELKFRTLVQSGDTTITTGATGNIIIYSSSDGSGEAVTGGTSYGGGVEVFTGTTVRDMGFRTLVGSGGIGITGTTGGTIIINSEGGTYDLDSPSVCEVGGMTIGTTLTGKTAFELFEEILVPVQNPALTAPSVVTTLSCSGTLEIGTTINPSLCVTSTYNAGCINPQYTATSDCRSCGVIGYCYTSTGGQVDGYYACTTSPVTQSAASYVVSGGTQTWGTCACHCAGVQPYDSKGDIYDSPLAESCTAANNKTITGILPWYWGTKKITNTITCDDINGGTKLVANANGTLSITYNSAADDYLWFAVPNGTTTKNSWFVCASNQGPIGGTGNLFAAACNVVVDSCLSCWAGCTFDVYASCFTTGTASGIPMCMIP